jgi:hypothetical protein
MDRRLGVIPRSDPLYALIVEGFPSFFHYPALRRGRPLPKEKPIPRITADEIGTYKDKFILSDRTPLFLDELRNQMGEGGFEKFTRELFAKSAVDDPAFRTLVLGYLPGFEKELTIWFDTTELPAALSQ